MQARNSCNEPTFLERSKEIMHDVIAGVPEGRFGIVAFDRLAFPITQMTYNHSYLRDAIENALFIGMTYQATRTDIANALSVVAQKKQDLPDIYGDVRYVILLTDGYLKNSEWRDDFEQTFKLLNWANLKVLVVGVGNPVETPIHVTSPDGECSKETIEIDGEVVRIPLRTDTLTFIASETQGRFFEEGQTRELISYIRSEGLVNLPPEGVVFGEDQRKNIGRIFLIPATVALLLFLML